MIMIRPPDDSSRPPQTTGPVARNQGAAEPAVTPNSTGAAPVVEPTPPAPVPTDTKNVAPQLEQVSKQDGQTFDPSKGVTFPGSRSASTTSPPRIALVSSLADEIEGPDFNNLGKDLEASLFYWKAACEASKSGAPEMANDLLAWAREFDPGAPDLPSKAVT